jgi:hypothetical protein
MRQRSLWIFLLGLLFTGRCLAVYLGMDRVALVQALGSPISSAAMGAHEILLYPNGVRIELEDGEVVKVEGMSFGVEPPAVSPVQVAPATAAETPAQGGADQVAQAEVEAEKQADSTQAAARAKSEDAILQMENAHNAPRETPRHGIDPVKLLVEFSLRWAVMLLTLKLTSMFWGVTVDWSGLMLVALADAATRMVLREAAVHWLNIYTLFYVDDAIAAIVMVIVLMKVSINRSLTQAVQLTITSKTFSIVVWAVVITAMMRRSFG